MKKEKGFTLLELFITAVFGIVLSFLVIVVFGISMGNYWYSEDGVLRELRVNHPKVERVLIAKRNIFEKSEITVLEDGKQAIYLLDSDVFWNYEFQRKEINSSTNPSFFKKSGWAIGRSFWF